MSQRRKNLLKIAGAGLVCIGIAGVFASMPNFARAVYNSFFKTVNIPVLVAVTGLFIGEMFFLREQKGDKRCRYVCMATAFMTSLLMLFHGHDSLYDKLMPGQDLTLISQTVREQNDIVDGDYTSLKNMWGIGALSYLQNYFGDRILIRESTEDNLDEYITEYAVPPDQMMIGEEITASDEFTDKLLTYPYCHFHGNDYVVDEYWKDTDAIRMIKGKDGYIFCSQELAEALQKNPQFTSGQYEEYAKMSYDSKSSLAISLVRDAAEGAPYKEIRQIIAMAVFLLLGLMIALPLWGEKYPALAFFMGFPMGTVFWSFCGMLLMVLNIPYNSYTICGSIVLLMGIWLYKKRASFGRLDRSLLLHFALISLCVITLLIYAKICSVSVDTHVKAYMGYRLAKFGSLREVLPEATPYGMIEPIVASVGFLFGFDYPYAFYPLTGISGIGILFAGIYYLYQKNGKSYESMLALGMGMLLLLSNYDFLLSIFYGLAQGPTAVYTLIVIVFITLKKQLDLPGFSYAVIVAATAITLIRVEGAAYTLFLLAASLGMEDDRLKMKKILASEAGIIIFWNIYQWIFWGRGGANIFWTPEKGIILISGSIAAIFLAVVFDKQWMIIQFLKRNYYLLLMTAITGGAAFFSVFLKRGMASTNFPVYLSHFSNSAENDTNSAAFWIFFLLMCPVLLSMRNRIAAYSVTVVAGYLILIYFICLFRGDLPLRLGYSDSARRTIVHIMSSAVWLLAYSMAAGFPCEKTKEPAS